MDKKILKALSRMGRFTEYEGYSNVITEKILALIINRAIGLNVDSCLADLNLDPFGDFRGDDSSYDLYVERYLYLDSNSAYEKLIDAFSERFVGTAQDVTPVFADELIEIGSETGNIDEAYKLIENTKNVLELIGVEYADVLKENTNLDDEVRDYLQNDPFNEYGTIFLNVIRSEELGKLYGDPRATDIFVSLKRLHEFQYFVKDGVFYGYYIFGSSNDGYYGEEYPVILEPFEVAELIRIYQRMEQLLSEREGQLDEKKAA